MLDSKLVLDTSVIVKWLSDEEEDFLEQADQILKDAENEGVKLFTTELAKYETANAILKGKQLDYDDAYLTLITFYSLPILFIAENETRAHETYKLADDLSITYYDASFISLAQELDATLITDNPRHQAPTLYTAKVTALSDYPLVGN